MKAPDDFSDSRTILPAGAAAASSVCDIEAASACSEMGFDQHRRPLFVERRSSEHSLLPYLLAATILISPALAVFISFVEGQTAPLTSYVAHLLDYRHNTVTQLTAEEDLEPGE